MFFDLGVVFYGDDFTRRRINARLFSLVFCGLFNSVCCIIRWCPSGAKKMPRRGGMGGA